MLLHRTVPLAACFLLASTLHAQYLTRDTTCWQLGGSGNAVLEDTVNDRIFIGGQFSTALYPAEMRNGVEADISSGLPVRRSAGPDGAVRCVATDGAGGWYIGGDFTQVAGQARSHLAHILPNGSLDAWAPVVNGPVKTMRAKGDTLYFGGGFTMVNNVAKSNMAAVRLSTGNNVPFGQAFANDTVRCMSLSNGRLYVGGDFTQMNGQVRSRLASFTVSTHALTTWAPVVGGRVHCLIATATAVYVGGEFTSINGIGRSRAASLEPTTNTVRLWDPSANNTVYCMALTGAYFFLGGEFSMVGGLSSNHIACVSSGALASPVGWSKNIDGAVHSMVVANNTLWVGGDFLEVDNAGRSRLAAFGVPGTAVPGTTDWMAATTGPVHALAVHGTSIYAGGDFDFFGLTRRSIVALDQVTGQPLPWNPDVEGVVRSLAQGADGTLYAAGSFTQVGGTARSHLVALHPVTGAVLPWNGSAGLGTVSSIAVSGDTLVACGPFGMLSGTPRLRIGAISLSTGTALAWNVPLGINDEPSALLLKRDTLFMCGKLSSVGGQSRYAVAAIRLSTATVLPFNVNCSAGSEAHYLARYADNLYAGGASGTWGTTTTNANPGLFKLNTNTGAVQPWTTPYSFAVAANADKVFTSTSGLAISTVDAPTGERVGNSLLVEAGKALMIAENGDLLSASTYVFGQDMPYGFLRVRVAPSITVRVMLDGPFDNGIMSDGLSNAGLLPLTEPYTALGYTHTGGGGGETAVSNINSAAYNVVDWMLLEYRDPSDPSFVVASQSVLVHNTGAIFSPSLGALAPFAPDPNGSYFVAVRHRNHLGVMTAQPVDFSKSPFIDFSLPATPVYGNNARKTNGTTGTLRSGDVNFDGTLKYTGTANDRDPILVRIGGAVPTNTATGYHNEDVNMDGVVKYTGLANDRDPILVNIGGTVPTNIRVHQLP